VLAEESAHNPRQNGRDVDRRPLHGLQPPRDAQRLAFIIHR
jgi:hypothetical protein